MRDAQPIRLMGVHVDMTRGPDHTLFQPADVLDFPPTNPSQQWNVFDTPA
jgi:hypothetical protein